MRAEAPSIASLLVFVAGGCSVPAPGFMNAPGRDLERAGVAALESNDLERAESLLTNALAKADEDGDCRLRISIRRELAITAERRGKTEDAERWNGEALATARGCGDLSGAFEAGVNAARIALDRDDIAAARPWIADAQKDAVKLGTLTARGEYQILQARLLDRDGAYVDAEAAAREAVRVFDMQGLTLEILLNHAAARMTLASILEHRDDSLGAIAELQHAASLARTAGDRRLEATAREHIATLLVARLLYEDARVCLESAIEDRLAVDDAKGALLALDRLIALANDSGRSDRLAEYAERRARLAPAPASVPK